MEESRRQDSIRVLKSSILPVHRQSFWLRRFTTSNNEFKKEQARRAAGSKQGDRENTVPTFKRMPPSLWIGYSYQLYPVSGQFQITVRLTGLLPEKLQNDQSTNIYMEIKMLRPTREEEAFEICIVKHGQQLKAKTVCFQNQCIQTLNEAKMQLTVFYKRGRILKRKNVISKWVAPIDTSKVLRSLCDWKNIKDL